MVVTLRQLLALRDLRGLGLRRENAHAGQENPTTSQRMSDWDGKTIRAIGHQQFSFSSQRRYMSLVEQSAVPPSFFTPGPSTSLRMNPRRST